MALPVPLAHLLSPDMYSHKVHSSAFIKSNQLINNLILVAHVFTAMPAIILGPILLYRPLLKNKPKTHRTLGTIYVVGCFLSAITVLPLALNNNPGSIGPVGFTLMAITWFFITFWAYTAARHKDFVAHRRWIIRSYAMTFAFIHVNVTYKFLLPIETLSPYSITAFQSLVSWQANLLIVELYMAATSFSGKFIGFKKWFKNLFHYAPQDKFYWSV